ncbi:hypothetical protein SODALDRAFT_359700 [Sodiomyces alkalinus F11]|uniref:Uncharacterized protein n=1 Tax=Sodiomyces alkalinus (strain CBS 110278 / VKM F-3762 / F11) TaxID=1314773 RepID=A0A3N2PVS6_SODAK|nr:hypothetical protein SODALDRAFT_359700 [Sodiomyces alkalinus F11]ROT38599.1 hypothetical protein SODALDRAFT_359700 [Sodiomyces alkalinus F11]
MLSKKQRTNCRQRHPHLQQHGRVVIERSNRRHHSRERAQWARMWSDEKRKEHSTRLPHERVQRRSVKIMWAREEKTSQSQKFSRGQHVSGGVVASFKSCASEYESIISSRSSQKRRCCTGWLNADEQIQHQVKQIRRIKSVILRGIMSEKIKESRASEPITSRKVTSAQRPWR